MNSPVGPETCYLYLYLSIYLYIYDLVSVHFKISNKYYSSPGERNGNPLQYSCLENLMGRGSWWATVYGVAKSQT